jgi:hypothetical protein
MSFTVKSSFAGARLAVHVPAVAGADDDEEDEEDEDG